RIKIQATLDDIDSLSKIGLGAIIEYPMFLENTIIRLLRTKYMDLKTQYDSLSNIYQGQHFKMIQLKSEMDSIQNNINEEINKIKVIQRALIPKKPVPIRNSKRILFGMVLGIGFGGCLAFIAEHFDRRFKTVGEAERELEVPFLGLIPHFKTGRKKNKLISLQSPHSLASEAYRNLRTWVQVPNKNLGSTLLLTSATPREGKSTTAANLAISFAQLGLEVLLVEADLRRPTLDRIFNFEGHIGLADILTRGIDWREAVQHIGIYNMEV